MFTFVDQQKKHVLRFFPVLFRFFFRVFSFFRFFPRVFYMFEGPGHQVTLERKNTKKQANNKK